MRNIAGARHSHCILTVIAQDPSVKDVEVYKIGHLGSLYATLKSLWELLANRSADPQDPAVHSLLSEPKRESNLVSTDELEASTHYRDVEIELQEVP